MKRIRTVAVLIPQEIHTDFRWAAKITGHNVQQAGYAAIEDYIAKVKQKLVTQSKRR